MMNKEDKLRVVRRVVCSAENKDKNAVNLLLEVAAQVGETVTFDTSEELGLSFNSKLFSCEVKFSLLSEPCRAIAANKKMAKSAAADQAIEMLRKVEGSPMVTVPRTPEVAHSPSSLRSPDDWSPASPSSGNPIGELQEMAATKGWELPIYELIHQKGQSHAMTFIMECKMNGLVSQGEGRSKKTAKRIAAENMLSMIRERQRLGRRDNSVEEDGAYSPFTYPRARTPELEPLPKSLRTGSRNWPAELPGSSAPKPLFFSSPLYDKPACEASAIDLRRLKVRSPPPVDETRPTKKTVESLTERGQKDGFTFTFHDLEKGYSGNYLCFVELSTSPSAICCGSGITQGAAHADAAHNALQYLDVVPVKG